MAWVGVASHRKLLRGTVGPARVLFLHAAQHRGLGKESGSVVGLHSLETPIGLGSRDPKGTFGAQKRPVSS